MSGFTSLKISLDELMVVQNVYRPHTDRGVEELVLITKALASLLALETVP